jgi:hypothetical protein
MKSTMELDEQIWEFFEDVDHKVESAAEEALRRIGWSAPIFSTRLAWRRGAGGAGDATCAQVWCVKLADIENEIRHCLSTRDVNPEAEVVNKFARTFEKIRDQGATSVTSN